jgi:hypothetical protein
VDSEATVRALGIGLLFGNLAMVVVNAGCIAFELKGGSYPMLFFNGFVSVLLVLVLTRQ